MRTAFQVYVLAICAAWVGVLVAVLRGLDWWHLVAALLAAVALLLLGGLTENHLERAEERELIRKFEEAVDELDRNRRP